MSYFQNFFTEEFDEIQLENTINLLSSVITDVPETSSDWEYRTLLYKLFFQRAIEYIIDNTDEKDVVSLQNGLEVYIGEESKTIKNIKDDESEKKTIKKSLDNESINLILIPLAIYTRIGHQNLIIIDKKYKRIEFFDPQGSSPRSDYNTTIVSVLQTYLEQTYLGLRTFSLFDYSRTCPTFGFQYYDLFKNKFFPDDRGGYCVLWTLLYIDLRVRYRNNDPKTLQKDLIRFIKFDISKLEKGYKYPDEVVRMYFRFFLYRYSKYVFDKIQKAIFPIDILELKNIHIDALFGLMNLNKFRAHTSDEEKAIIGLMNLLKKS